MTLIEVLIVIAIVSAMAAIAVPSVSQYLIASERHRAQLDLYQLQVHVEQVYTATGNYPTDNELICSKCQVSDEYDFSITHGRANNAYLIKATPKSASRQSKDSDCHTMTLNAASEQSNLNAKGQALSGDKCWI